MQINGPAHVHGPQPINAPHRAKAASPTPSSQPAAPTDQLDISQEADMVSRMRDIPDIRQELVSQIRSQIEAGTYETEQRLSGAVDRLFDEIG